MQICRTRLRWRPRTVFIRFLKYPVLFAFVVGAGGCAVGPHYKAPQPAAVKYHAADPQLVTDTPFDSRWWNQFEDPVLDSLIQKSLTANTSIRVARARLAESRAIFDERKLDRYPTVPADASYTYAKQQIPGFFNDPATINTFRSGFDASWEVDLFGRVRHGVAAARSDNQAVEADLHDVEVKVVAALALNCFRLSGRQWLSAFAS